MMTLIYSSLENINQEVIAVSKDTNKLRLYHREDDVSRLEVDKVCLFLYSCFVCRKLLLTNLLFAEILVIQELHYVLSILLHSSVIILTSNISTMLLGTQHYLKF